MIKTLIMYDDTLAAKLQLSQILFLVRVKYRERIIYTQSIYYYKKYIYVCIYTKYLFKL